MFFPFKVLFLSFSFCVLFVQCQPKKDSPKNDKVAYTIPDTLLQRIKIDTVSTCSLVSSITLTGSVDFDQDHQVNIYPLVSGIVQDVKVQLGDNVRQGQTLATVRSSEMATISNNLIVAQTNVTGTKRQFDAAKGLFSSGLASQTDVTNAQVNYDQAVGQLEMVNRILKINGSSTNGEFVVKSPISGFIVQKNITNSTSIRADNGNNIFTVSQLDNVWVNANVYESNISKVHLGDDVDVTTISYPNRVFKGKINKIINVLDPTSKVMKLRIVLSNKDYALKPQMFTSVIVKNKENKSAICIPSSALIFDHSQYYVLVYKGKGESVITPVDVLSTTGSIVYLNSGVKEGDKIIGSEALLIYDELNN